MSRKVQTCGQIMNTLSNMVFVVKKEDDFLFSGLQFRSRRHFRLLLKQLKARHQRHNIPFFRSSKTTSKSIIVSRVDIQERKRTIFVDQSTR